MPGYKMRIPENFGYNEKNSRGFELLQYRKPPSDNIFKAIIEPE
jgi:hypothetical protein